MKKHFNIFILLLASSLLLLFTACTFVQETDNKPYKKIPVFDRNTVEIKVYFTRSKVPQEIELVSVKRRVSKDDSIVAGALRELFIGPTKNEKLKGIMSEIPIGTRLIDVEEGEDEVLINVSSKYVTGGGSATMQLRYQQIYKTLKKIVPFKEIYMNVDGKVLKTIGGEGLEVTQPLTMIEDYTKKYAETESVQP